MECGYDSDYDCHLGWVFDVVVEVWNCVFSRNRDKGAIENAMERRKGSWTCAACAEEDCGYLCHACACPWENRKGTVAVCARVEGGLGIRAGEATWNECGHGIGERAECVSRSGLVKVSESVTGVEVVHESVNGSFANRWGIVDAMVEKAIGEVVVSTIGQGRRSVQV